MNGGHPWMRSSTASVDSVHGLMQRPLVSIVMPMRDAQESLHSSIRSICEQTYEEWELLIVDDGSRDRSRQIASEFAREENRIQILRETPEPGGIVAALNAGIAVARGPLIARMDADDEALPERVGAQVAYLTERPGVGVVGTQVIFGGDRDSAEGYGRYVDWTNRLVDPDEIFLNRFIESPLPHPSVMCRRSLFSDFGSYREGPFPEDYELWLRWWEAGVRMGKVARPLLLWNDPPERLSRRDQRYVPDAFFRCKAEYLSRWVERSVPGEREIWAWGAGRTTRRRANFLIDAGVSFACYIDIDPAKVGNAIQGVPVRSPDEIPEPSTCFVLGCVGARGAREGIREFLNRRGFREGRDYLMVA